MERILVVKVGTSTVATATGLNGKALMRLAGAVSDLADRGWRTVIVTSGAVGAGRARLGMAERPRTIAAKQAAASVGQGLLMHAYETFLAPLGLASAQLLLTRADLSDRQRYLNASNTLRALLDHDVRVVPVINENDSVAIDELKFGDNDTLSALVAQLVDADWLAILSDVDGLYDKNPGKHPDATLIPEVPELTPEIEALAGGAGSDVGTGGMVTKLAAARIATASGIPMALMSGQAPARLVDLCEGRAVRGTIFRAREDRLEARKRWLAFGMAVKGVLSLDEGAVRALVQGNKSLLPTGVTGVEGDFLPGETVSLRDGAGRELGRGIANYGATELHRIQGRKSSEVEKILGFKVADEVIHRDNLVVL
ncbi:MAG TPA: glutamate 5-kinase [Pantanalinema sp.]